MVKWFEDNHTIFPWRQDKDPYKIWLSEIMLQQTTVASVIPYFEAFTKAYPTLKDLGNAEIQDVLHLWQGLGYYRRAHMLHRGAQYMLNNFDGDVPRGLKNLLCVPGIGNYTARAVLSMAFGEPHVPVDGNVIRVLSRVFALTSEYAFLERELSPHLLQFEEALKNGHPGFFAQSLMDLGREICKPKNPKCDSCPIQKYCKANTLNLQESIPLKKKKPPQPWRYARATIYLNNGKVFVTQNDTSGLFPGLWGVPLTSMSDTPLEILNHGYIGEVKHTFTHFKLLTQVYISQTSPDSSGQFILMDNLGEFPLSTLMKKVFSLYLGESRKKTAA